VVYIYIHILYVHTYVCICYFLFVGFVIVGVVCVVWHTALCILTFSRFLIFEKKQIRVVLRELTRNLDSSIFGVCKKSSMCNTRNTVLNRGLILCLHTCTLRFFTFLPRLLGKFGTKICKLKTNRGGGLKYTFLSL
jgi:hypothetical protein